MASPTALRTRSPRAVPVLPGLPVLGSALALRRDQLATYERARSELGGLVRLVAGPPGWRLDVYAVFEPAYVQHVLVDAADRYRKDSRGYVELAAALGDGLLTSQDERWRRQRRFLAPLFTRRRLDDYAGTVAEEAAQLVERWQRRAGDSGTAEVGVEVDAHAEMVRFALRVMGRVLLGADVEAVIPAITAALPVVGDRVLRRTLSPRPLPRSWPTPGSRRARSARRMLYDAVDELIADRRAAAAETAPRSDLLGRLLAARDPGSGWSEALDDDEVRDQILIFLLAGHETTATTMTCVLSLLGSHPQVQQRVHGEVDEVLAGRAPTAGDLPALPYTDAVVREALRLYPPVYVIPRLAGAGDEIDGFRVPPGAIVIASPWVTHRDPELWPQPRRFDPARFLAPAPERHRYAWFPFGAGPRTCIGMQLALLESVLTVATIAQRYTIVSSGRVPLETAITLRPARPVPCQLIPRG